MFNVAGDESVTNVRLAQLDRAFGYGPKGREFESSNAHEALKMRVFRAFLFDKIDMQRKAKKGANKWILQFPTVIAKNVSCGTR